MNLFFSLISVFFLFILEKFLYEKYWDRHLSININFSSDTAYEGDELYLEETILNQKLLPLPILKIKFKTSKYLIFEDLENVKISDNLYRNDITPIFMYQKLTRTLPFNCSHRGYYTLDRADILSSDIFISVENIKILEFTNELYVYPKQITNPEFDTYSQCILGSIITNKKITEDPFEFKGIREYQTYDTMKTINWKATAKTSELKVNTYDFTCSQQISIIINLESYLYFKKEDIEEESIRLAASLANLFISRKIPTSLITNGYDTITKELVSVPSGSGNMHMSAVNKKLARLDTNIPFSNFTNILDNYFLNRSSNDFLIIISANASEQIQNILLNNYHNSQKYVWIIPQFENAKYQINSRLSSNVISHYV